MREWSRERCLRWPLLVLALAACAAPQRRVLTAPIDTTGALVPSALTDSVVGQQTSGTTQPAYFEFQVEKVAVPLLRDELRGPRYPDDLRTQKVEGDVLVQFVVDAAGRPDMSSFRVIRATHAKFGASVREFISTLHFEPARLKGRNVAQLVQQPFEFRIGP